MDLKLESSDDASRLDLPPVMDIAVAGELHGALRQAAERGMPLTINAESVERMSTPCAQVLLAAANTMTRSNMAFTLASPSDGFIEAFSDLGLFPVLKQWNIE